MSTPRQRGFRMPPEWAPHRRCWMIWACSRDSFPELESARDDYAAVARAIARFEPVSMIVSPDDAEDVNARCGGTVELVTIPSDDSWARDSGPTFVVDGRGGLAGVDWEFNGYGRLYDDFEVDAAVARRILEHLDLPRFEAPLVFEGGALHTDGRGTLLTTESVALNPNRNPGRSREEIEEVFRDYLGVEKIIWLDKALEVDSTDGHVDNLACFARPGVVTVLDEVDPNDSHYEALKENQRRLERERDASGNRLEIIRIQQPARREWNGERLGMSYINYYIANGAIVVPVFGDPADEAACSVLARAFPEREIVPVLARELIKGQGCIHCITQQEPLP